MDRSNSDGVWLRLPPITHESECVPTPMKQQPDASYSRAIEAGERAHLLTVGSPVRGLCLRVCMGNLDRRGNWHRIRPDVFFIWRGRRVFR